MEGCDCDEGLLVNDDRTFAYAEAKSGQMWNQNQSLFTHCDSVITGQLKQGECACPNMIKPACSMGCNERAAALCDSRISSPPVITD